MTPPEDIRDSSATYSVVINPTDDDGNQVPPGSIIGYNYVPHEVDVENITAKFVVPYEASNNDAPRGDSGYELDDISKIVQEQVIKKAEDAMMATEPYASAAAIDMEKLESEFVNYGYAYPEEAEASGYNKEIVKAEPLSLVTDYKREIAFYNFSPIALGANTEEGQKTEAETIELFKEYIKNAFELHDQSELLAKVKEYLTLYYCNLTVDGCYRMPAGFQVPTPIPPNGGEVTNLTYFVTEINWVALEEGGENGPIAIGVDSDVYELTNILMRNGGLQENYMWPPVPSYYYNVTSGEYNAGTVFTSVKEQTAQDEWRALYDIDEYVISMTQQICQKRIATMIITDVESWAKSADYSISITNNIFDYTNYRYVVPHSYYSFGVKVFKIDEIAAYRTDYYKEYFSKVNDPDHVGIKEADILTMMLKWEEYARSGVDTAYAFMRDLYKLVIYTRERFSGDAAQILDSAYSYLYVPDTIWEFREGISQEAFWTERLAAEVRRRRCINSGRIRKS